MWIKDRRLMCLLRIIPYVSEGVWKGSLRHEVNASWWSIINSGIKMTKMSYSIPIKVDHFWHPLPPETWLLMTLGGRVFFFLHHQSWFILALQHQVCIARRPYPLPPPSHTEASSSVRSAFEHILLKRPCLLVAFCVVSIHKAWLDAFLPSLLEIPNILSILWYNAHLSGTNSQFTSYILCVS